ncbi:MAG: MFS transporter [Anaerolineaceae bacterium]|nr:MFS transporter [Anaerolineaceae bacterium]
MKHKSSQLAILFFTMIIVMMGFGMVIPILPFYIENFGATGKDLGFLLAIFSVMQFIFAPIWGTLSDRYGRKPILIVGVLGNAISLLLFGLSTELWMMFAARALGGILSAATLPTAMAFIGDSTDAKNRGGGMGIIGAAMGVGMTIGPGIGGWMSDISLSAPFFLGAALSVLAMLAMIFFLPESLPPEKRDTTARLQGPKISEMGAAILGPLGIMFFMAFIVSFAMTSFEGIFSLFAEARFDFNARQVGTIMMVVGVISAIVQGGLTGPATKKFGEVMVIKISLIGSVFGFLVMLLAIEGAGIYLSVAFFMVFNAMLRPAIAALISNQSESGQGIAMGLNNSFMSAGRIIGPIWAGYLFDFNTSAPYLSGSAVMLISFVIAMIFLNGKKYSTKFR